MKMKTADAILCFAFLFALVVTPALRACGPFFPVPVYVPRISPDVPIKSFIGGELGVVQPSFAQVYLYVAYRNLAEKRFDAEEAVAVESFWGPQPEVVPPPDGWKPGQPRDWVQEWRNARKTIPGTKDFPLYGYGFGAGVERYLPATYQFFVNCQEDAFRTATLTLKDRSKQFGSESVELQEWLAAQDVVFSNCRPDEKAPGPFIPEPAKSEWRPWLRADRAYQVAASHFYAGQFDNAREAFEEIGKDETSPWRRLGPYLAARNLIRKGTLGEGWKGYDAEALAQAETRLKAILADPRQKELHAAAKRLAGFVGYRLHTRVRAEELSRLLLGKESLGTRAQDLIDFTRILNRFVPDDAEWLAEKKAEVRAESFAEFSEFRRMSELADWILTMQAQSDGARKHALARWEETKSASWLVASITKAGAKDDRAMELAESARSIPRASPAFFSVRYHRERLLSESGQAEIARGELDELLGSKLVMPRSTRNLLLALRMKVARNFEEFLRFAPRLPARICIDFGGEPDCGPGGWGDQGDKKQPLLDDDAARIMNRGLPLALLQHAVEAKTFPENLRREAAIAAWTRAVAVKDFDRAAKLAPFVAALVPDAKPPLDQFLASTDIARRNFVATYWLLKFPGFTTEIAPGIARETPLNKIDNFRRNWWCGLNSPLPGNAPQTIADSSPAFLDANLREARQAEAEKLSKLPAAPNYLAAIVLAWARQHPEDERVPEALHLTVRSTRYGCGDDNTSKFSRQAFQLLHKKYPKSEWAKKTPYWY
jgi:hypothetical protein